MLDYPFLRHEFLSALENSGSVNKDTGWQALHIELPSVFMPLYLKSHSWGEYVFDWSWADAYQRNNLAYYPKLVSAIPFTPATGPRVVSNETPLDSSTCRQLVEQVKDLANEHSASSWHLLFPNAAQLALFRQPELLYRAGVQFHWFNRDYQDFEDFLSTLVSRKRKMIKRERRSIAAQKLSIKQFDGPQITPELWGFFYDVYTNTYLKHSGNIGYLNRQFFSEIATTMPEQIAMIAAFEDNSPIACALYLFDDTTLFGRYWGCRKDVEYLHFELCYYQAIELAIAKKLQKFDAGAQGEHKIIRGFEPITTHSLHWIKNPRFAGAIADFLKQEQRHNKRYIAQANTLLPYKTIE